MESNDVVMDRALAQHYKEALEKIERLPHDRNLFGYDGPIGEQAVEIAARAFRTAPHGG